MCTGLKSNVSYALNSWPPHNADDTSLILNQNIIIQHEPGFKEFFKNFSVCRYLFTDEGFTRVVFLLCNYF